MPTDYEKVYHETRHALGEPAKEFVRFFKSLNKSSLRVLDIGCGQGRDAMFVSRLGHRVVGVDQSSTGIRDLLADAAAENLQIEGYVADIRVFEPDGLFNVLLFDRVLHMLDENDRVSTLARFLVSVVEGGCVLIADERSNIAALEKVFIADSRSWHPEFKRRGYLFMQREE